MPDDTTECANCGEPGNPGHHWMGGMGYVCHHRPELTEDAPPPSNARPALITRTWDVDR